MPWSKFFHTQSINKFVPVIEFHRFLKGAHYASYLYCRFEVIENEKGSVMPEKRSSLESEITLRIREQQQVPR